MTACFIDSGLEHGNFLNSDISQGRVLTQLRCGGIINKGLLQIYYWICQWKNFENQSTFGEVMGNIIVACFLLTHGVVCINGKPYRQYKYRASTSTRWHFTFVLCCHSNEIRALIANMPNRAQLGGNPTILPSYIQVHAVWECGEGHTDRQTRMTNIHFASSTTHAKCNNTDFTLFYGL